MAQGKNGSDLLFGIGVDTGAMRIGLRDAERDLSVTAKQMKVHLEGVGKPITSMGTLFGKIGVDGSAAFGRIGGSLQQVATIAGSIATGGLASALGATIFAVGGAVFSKVEEMQRAGDHLKALNAEFGVTKKDVDAVVAAMNKAGLSVDRMAAQQISRLAKEAGISSEEVAGLTGRMKQLATLDGLDPVAAAQKVFDAYTEGAKKTKEVIEAVLQSIAGRTTSASAEMQALGDRSEEANKRLSEAETTLKSLRAELAGATKDQADASALAAAAPSSSTISALRTAAARVDELNVSIAKTEKEAASAGEEIKTLSDAAAKVAEQEKTEKILKEAEARKKRAEQIAKEAAARAKARVAASFETNITVAVAARDEEGAAVARLAQALAQLEQRRRSGQISDADAARQAKALAVQNQEAVDAITRQMVAQQMDATLGLRQAEAELARDAVAQAKARAEGTLEQLRRQQDEQTRLAQATANQISELEANAGGERAAAEIERLRRLHDQRVALVETTGQQIALAERQAAQELVRLQTEQLRRDEDYARETTALRVRGTETEVEVIQARADAELLVVQRLEEDKTITLAQAEERREAIRAAAARDIAAASNRQAGAAFAAGAQFGSNYVQGIRSIIESDDARGVFKGILQIVGAIASIIPGGQAFGVGLNIFAGMFAKGGVIGGRQRYGGAFASGGAIGGRYVRGPGTGTSDDVVIRASNGEFVSTEKAVRRFGVRFFEGLNRGVLDVEALPRFAAGGAVGAAAAPAPVPAGAPTSVTLEQHVSFGGSIMSREILMREMAPALRQMAIEATSSIVRQLGLQPGAVTARG